MNRLFNIVDAILPSAVLDCPNRDGGSGQSAMIYEVVRRYVGLARRHWAFDNLLHVHRHAVRSRCAYALKQERAWCGNRFSCTEKSGGNPAASSKVFVFVFLIAPIFGDCRKFDRRAGLAAWATQMEVESVQSLGAADVAVFFAILAIGWWR